MDAQAAKRLAGALADRQEAILDRWTQIVRESLRGRLTRAELARQTERPVRGAAWRPSRAAPPRADAPEAADLLDLLGRAVAQPGPPGLHRDRDRDQRLRPQGRAAGRTWPTATPRRWPTSPRSRSFVDKLGLHHLRDVRQRARRGHRRAVGATARAVDAGGEAVGRRGGGPAHRHPRLGPLPGRHGAAAAGAGRHRLPVRDPRHHRRAGGGHPGRPAHPQDRDGGPVDGRASASSPASGRRSPRRSCRSASSSARS